MRCALVAASDFNESMFLQLRENCYFDAVLAVDGGYEHVRAVGVVPDFAVGDFDSLGYVPTDASVLTFPEEKDDSDLALALDWASSQGFTELFVFGAFGGRVDHTLAALQAMRACAQGNPQLGIFGVTDTQMMRILRAGETLVFPGKTQSKEILSGPKEYRTFSLVALSDAVVGATETGMKYPLDNAVLTNAQTLGLSNELTGVDATVAVEGGVALAVWSLSIGIPNSLQKTLDE